MSMKRMLILVIVGLSFCIFLLLFGLILVIDEEDGSQGLLYSGGMSLSAEVLAYQVQVEKYCKMYGIEEYISYILAIMQVESGGNGNDVMQCSESLGLPPNTLSPDASIEQGCKYFSQLLLNAEERGCDIDTVVQAYNFGGQYTLYVAENGKKHTFELAEAFAYDNSGGTRVNYPNPVAVAKNGGWRYAYGNMFYVELVHQYLGFMQFDDETVQALMQEALKYQGWKYVYGGSTPETSFDCSGLVQWCYGVIGVDLPRTAQAQYDATVHVDLSQAAAGDLVFFYGTYNAGTYITHVGIYCGNNQMYHAGDPIGYADLTSSYWQEHLVCAGKVDKKGMVE